MQHERGSWMELLGSPFRKKLDEKARSYMCLLCPHFLWTLLVSSSRPCLHGQGSWRPTAVFSVREKCVVSKGRGEKACILQRVMGSNPSSTTCSPCVTCTGALLLRRPSHRAPPRVCLCGLAELNAGICYSHLWTFCVGVAQKSFFSFLASPPESSFLVHKIQLSYFFLGRALLGPFAEVPMAHDPKGAVVRPTSTLLAETVFVHDRTLNKRMQQQKTS